MSKLRSILKSCASGISSLCNIKNYISAIIVMNVIDAVLTWYWVTEGIAEELNPIMDYALSESSILFFTAKLSLTTLGCILLWRANKFQRAARICAAGLVGLYLAIMVSHGSIAINVF